MWSSSKLSESDNLLLNKWEELCEGLVSSSLFDKFNATRRDLDPPSYDSRSQQRRRHSPDDFDNNDLRARDTQTSPQVHRASLDHRCPPDNNSDSPNRPEIHGDPPTTDGDQTAARSPSSSSSSSSYSATAEAQRGLLEYWKVTRMAELRQLFGNVSLKKKLFPMYILESGSGFIMSDLVPLLVSYESTPEDLFMRTVNLLFRKHSLNNHLIRRFGNCSCDPRSDLAKQPVECLFSSSIHNRYRSDHIFDHHHFRYNGRRNNTIHNFVDSSHQTSRLGKSSRPSTIAMSRRMSVGNNTNNNNQTTSSIHLMSYLSQSPSVSLPSSSHYAHRFHSLASQDSSTMIASNGHIQRNLHGSLSGSSDLMRTNEDREYYSSFSNDNDENDEDDNDDESLVFHSVTNTSPRRNQSINVNGSLIISRPDSLPETSPFIDDDDQSHQCRIKTHAKSKENKLFKSPMFFSFNHFKQWIWNCSLFFHRMWISSKYMSIWKWLGWIETLLWMIFSVICIIESFRIDRYDQRIKNRRIRKHLIQRPSPIRGYLSLLLSIILIFHVIIGIIVFKRRRKIARLVSLLFPLPQQLINSAHHHRRRISNHNHNLNQRPIRNFGDDDENENDEDDDNEHLFFFDDDDHHHRLNHADVQPAMVSSLAAVGRPTFPPPIPPQSTSSAFASHTGSSTMSSSSSSLPSSSSSISSTMLDGQRPSQRMRFSQNNSCHRAWLNAARLRHKKRLNHLRGLLTLWCLEPFNLSQINDLMSVNDHRSFYFKAQTNDENAHAMDDGARRHRRFAQQRREPIPLTDSSSSSFALPEFHVCSLNKVNVYELVRTTLKYTLPLPWLIQTFLCFILTDKSNGKTGDIDEIKDWNLLFITLYPVFLLLVAYSEHILRWIQPCHWITSEEPMNHMDHHRHRQNQNHNVNHNDSNNIIMDDSESQKRNMDENSDDNDNDELNEIDDYESEEITDEKEESTIQETRSHSFEYYYSTPNKQEQSSIFDDNVNDNDNNNDHHHPSSSSLSQTSVSLMQVTPDQIIRKRTPFRLRRNSDSSAYSSSITRNLSNHNNNQCNNNNNNIFDMDDNDALSAGGISLSSTPKRTPTPYPNRHHSLSFKNKHYHPHHHHERPSYHRRSMKMTHSTLSIISAFYSLFYKSFEFAYDECYTPFTSSLLFILLFNRIQYVCIQIYNSLFTLMIFFICALLMSAIYPIFYLTSFPFTYALMCENPMNGVFARPYDRAPKKQEWHLAEFTRYWSMFMAAKILLGSALVLVLDCLWPTPPLPAQPLNHAHHRGNHQNNNAGNQNVVQPVAAAAANGQPAPVVQPQPQGRVQQQQQQNPNGARPAAAAGAPPLIGHNPPMQQHRPTNMADYRNYNHCIFAVMFITSVIVVEAVFFGTMPLLTVIVRLISWASVYVLCCLASVRNLVQFSLENTQQIPEVVQWSRLFSMRWFFK